MEGQKEIQNEIIIQLKEAFFFAISFSLSLSVSFFLIFLFPSFTTWFANISVGVMRISTFSTAACLFYRLWNSVSLVLFN